MVARRLRAARVHVVAESGAVGRWRREHAVVPADRLDQRLDGQARFGSAGFARVERGLVVPPAPQWRLREVQRGRAAHGDGRQQATRDVVQSRRSHAHDVADVDHAADADRVVGGATIRFQSQREWNRDIRRRTGSASAANDAAIRIGAERRQCRHENRRRGRRARGRVRLREPWSSHDAHGPAWLRDEVCLRYDQRRLPRRHAIDGRHRGHEHRARILRRGNRELECVRARTDRHEQRHHALRRAAARHRRARFRVVPRDALWRSVGDHGCAQERDADRARRRQLAAARDQDDRPGRLHDHGIVRFAARAPEVDDRAQPAVARRIAGGGRERDDHVRLGPEVGRRLASGESRARDDAVRLRCGLGRPALPARRGW